MTQLKFANVKPYNDSVSKSNNWNKLIFTVSLATIILAIGAFVIFSVHSWEWSLTREIRLWSAQCPKIEDAYKFDCYPEDGGSEEKCKERGCCWVPRGTKKAGMPPLNVPWCYYPNNYGGYKYVNITASNNGVVAYLKCTFPSHYPNDISLLRMNVEFVTDYQLHVKVCVSTVINLNFIVVRIILKNCRREF